MSKVEPMNQNHSINVSVDQDATLPRCTFTDGVYVTPFNWKKKSLSNVFGMLRMKRSVLTFPGVSDNIALIKSAVVDKVLSVPHARDGTSGAYKSDFTWLGHACCLYRADGTTFITDPVFSQRCSPSQWVGPSRYVAAPCDVLSLHLDVVLLSHTHYDHLDASTAEKLSKNTKLLWIVPLGVKEWLAGYDITNVVELGWWDTYTYTSERTGETSKITFTPANHWTNRSLWDQNTCLWGSYCVKSESSNFFFSGDTAYDLKHNVFRTIGEKYGPFDQAAIGIGAYKPRFFMKDNHVNPREAVQIALDVKASHTCGIHWGTFPLAYEDPVEPAFDLAHAREKLGLTHKEFYTMEHGETIQVLTASSSSAAAAAAAAAGDDALAAGGATDLVFNNPSLYELYKTWPQDPVHELDCDLPKQTEE